MSWWEFGAQLGHRIFECVVIGERRGKTGELPQFPTFAFNSSKKFSTTVSSAARARRAPQGSARSSSEQPGKYHEVSHQE